MVENNETPEEVFARAERDRDASVRDLLGSAKTQLQKESALVVTRRRTSQIDQAARRFGPPQRFGKG